MKKVLRVAANVIAWLVLIFVFLITLVVFSSGKNNGVANLFGYIPLTVESDSMKPTFEKNDLIICKEIDDVNSLKEGDVITFWTVIDGRRVKNTHRIMEINDTDGSKSFITRGDNNPVDDTSPAYSGDLIGKWTETKISGFGKIMSFLRTKKGFFICIVLPMAIFFLFELYKFIVTLVEVKRPEAAEQLDEEEIKRRAIEEYLASKGESAESAVAKAAEKADNKAEAAAEKAVEKVEEAVEAKAEKAAEKAEEAVEAKAEKAAEKVEEAVEAKAEKAAEKAEEAVEEQAEKLADTVENAEETLENTAEKLAEKSEDTAEKAVDAAAETVKKAGEAAE